jgi:hypothetical protein
VAEALELVRDFGIRAPILDDLDGNVTLCGDERVLGILLGGCRLGGRRLALSPLKVCLVKAKKLR